MYINYAIKYVNVGSFAGQFCHKAKLTARATPKKSYSNSI